MEPCYGRSHSTRLLEYYARSASVKLFGLKFKLYGTIKQIFPISSDDMLMLDHNSSRYHFVRSLDPSNDGKVFVASDKIRIFFEQLTLEEPTLIH